MENPEPVREHRELEKLAGHFAGSERMHPSYFNADAKRGEATTDAHVALDGFAVVQDYEQQLEDGSHFAGHGVFRYDMPSDTYEMHWFDSTGGPVRIFRGGFADRMLVLTGRAGDGWQRLTYDFNLAGGYRFKLETSEDGNTWRVALEGDNLQERRATKPAGTQRRAAKKAGGARRKTVAASRRKATAKKATAKKATAKKATAKKATAKKATAKKATAKKATAKKAAAKKAAAKKAAAKKATAKKATAKKATRRTAGRKAAANRAPARKAATKRTTAKKAAAKKTAKKATAKKASAGKASAKKVRTKKARAKSSPARKAGATTRVAEVERRRRKGKTSRALAAKKATARGKGSAASRRSASQKKTKSAAQEAPRMPTLKKTSTRTGWHRTAAKGVRG